MRERVDAEGEVEVALCGVEDGFAARDARVVDEDCGAADGGADLGGGGGDGGRGGEVAGEEVDVGRCWDAALALFAREEWRGRGEGLFYLHK